MRERISEVMGITGLGLKKKSIHAMGMRLGSEFIKIGTNKERIRDIC
jgi:hypothetical protein